jgi:UrcA family protein
MTRASTAYGRDIASILCAGAALLAPVIGTPAFAQPPIYVPYEVLPSVTVNYADLDLARSSDVDRLRVRVRTAAHSICFDATRNPLMIQALDQDCYSIALSRANHAIDQVVLDKVSGASVSATLQAIVVQVP